MTTGQRDARSIAKPAAASEAPVGAPTLRHFVLATLRRRIVNGDVKPGSRLHESDIAAEMGTSRGPVRESLRQLEQEGLVEFFPHRGAVVVGVPEDELAGVMGLRAVIEARGFSIAADFLSKNDFDRLKAIAGSHDAALRSRDIEKVVGLDRRFHAYILEVSGLVLLRRIWDSLDGLMRVDAYKRLDRAGREPVEPADIPTHVNLLDALGRRDDALIRRSIVRHILRGAPPPI